MADTVADSAPVPTPDAAAAAADATTTAGAASSCDGAATTAGTGAGGAGAGAPADDKKLLIIHYNDVYNVNPGTKEPVGGAARLKSAFDAYSAESPLVLFSGDCLSPSTTSLHTKGHHMVPVINGLGTAASCLGNHDLDFGIPNFKRFVAASSYPWLCSNAVDSYTKQPFAGCEVKRIIDANGIKVGVMGLIEEEWIVSLGTVEPSEVKYTDFVTVGTRLAAELRAQGAQMVVALTHMRLHNDQRLAREAAGIDLILGGHDHFFDFMEENGVTIVKSGTDFRNYTEIRVSLPADGGRAQIVCTKHDVTSDVPEDPAMKAICDEATAEEVRLQAKVIGYTENPLDAQSTSVRSKETNVGNFVCDIVREVTKADCVIINGGTFRSDATHGPGLLQMKDLQTLLPFTTFLIKLKLTGALLRRVLDAGVSGLPAFEGRFPQVSGLRFVYKQPTMSGQVTVPARVVPNSIYVKGKPLDPAKSYTLVVPSFIGRGKDGYEVLKEAEIVADEEAGYVLNTMVRNHFRLINGVNLLKHTSGDRSVLKKVDRMVKAARKLHTQDHGEKQEEPSTTKPAMVNAAKAFAGRAGAGARTPMPAAPPRTPSRKSGATAAAAPPSLPTPPTSAGDGGGASAVSMPAPAADASTNAPAVEASVAATAEDVAAAVPTPAAAGEASSDSSVTLGPAGFHVAPTRRWRIVKAKHAKFAKPPVEASKSVALPRAHAPHAAFALWTRLRVDLSKAVDVELDDGGDAGAATPSIPLVVDADVDDGGVPAAST